MNPLDDHEIPASKKGHVVQILAKKGPVGSPLVCWPGLATQPLGFQTSLL